MSSLYGEYADDDAFKPQKAQPIQPPEIKVVQVKDDSSVPFRWKVASQMMHGIINNQEYSRAISTSISKRGNSDRKAFQEEVAVVAIGLADTLIDKLNATTKVEKSSNE